MKWQSPGLGKSGLCFMFYNILEKEGASIFDTPSMRVCASPCQRAKGTPLSRTLRPALTKWHPDSVAPTHISVLFVVFRHIPHIDISGGRQHVNVLAAKVALADAPKLHIFRILAF